MPPMAETVEVKAEGVVCESGVETLRDNYGDPLGVQSGTDMRRNWPT